MAVARVLFGAHDRGGCLFSQAHQFLDSVSEDRSGRDLGVIGISAGVVGKGVARFAAQRVSYEGVAEARSLAQCGEGALVRGAGPSAYGFAPDVDEDLDLLDLEQACEGVPGVVAVADGVDSHVGLPSNGLPLVYRGHRPPASSPSSGFPSYG